MQQMSNAGPPSADARAMLNYDGRLSELFGIFLLNLLLTIITLGIFRFWAITRIRRYLWSHMRFEGTRFSYTGRGGELFVAFLLAIVVLLLLFGAAFGVSFALAKIHPALAAIPMIVTYVLIFVLFGAARFSAQRYRLSRTEWRGIRGGMRGSALRYGVSWLLFAVLVVVTLYQAVPWMQVGLARRRINASRFGSAEFQCDGRGGQLYLGWLATIVGCLMLFALMAAVIFGLERSTLAPTFTGLIHGDAAKLAVLRALPVIVVGIVAYMILAGMLTTWYYARLLRLILHSTGAVIPGARAATVRFGTSLTTGGLFWLVVSNALIALLTLGLGLPIVLHRYARFIARTTLMSGAFDAEALAQSSLARPALGEGFLQALDPGIV